MLSFKDVFLVTDQQMCTTTLVEERLKLVNFETQWSDEISFRNIVLSSGLLSENHFHICALHDYTFQDYHLKMAFLIWGNAKRVLWNVKGSPSIGGFSSKYPLLHLDNFFRLKNLSEATQFKKGVVHGKFESELLWCPSHQKQYPPLCHWPALFSHVTLKFSSSK